MLIEKVTTVSQKLTYSHYVELLSLSNVEEINYYIMISNELNLSVRQLREKIKSKEYDWLSISAKNKLIAKQETNIVDLVKDPITIRNNVNENISEKLLQKLILEDIEAFMQELGTSFSFIGSEYKIKIGNTFNYINLLFFNIEYNCYVVIELKVTE